MAVNSVHQDPVLWLGLLYWILVTEFTALVDALRSSVIRSIILDLGGQSLLPWLMPCAGLWLGLLYWILVDRVYCLGWCLALVCDLIGLLYWILVNRVYCLGWCLALVCDLIGLLYWILVDRVYCLGWCLALVNRPNHRPAQGINQGSKLCPPRSSIIDLITDQRKASTKAVNSVHQDPV